MKAIFLFALLVVAIAARSDQETHQAWRDFTSQFQKNYPGHEAVRRFKIFKDNVDYIDRINAMNKGYQLGINQFADLTSAEYATLLGFRGTMEDHLIGQPKDPKMDPVPPTFDWRTKGVVTPVKNQEQCGSCWAFSTTGSTEGCHALATGKLVSLSEKNLMDCSVPEGNQGCNGGLMTQAMEYIIKNHGIDTEASYPYAARDGKCHFNASNIGATLKSYENVPTGDEKQLLNFATHGPVSVAIDASHQSFQLYKSGVYYEPKCSSSQLDHGVLVVGWGVENGKDYFLVKNSWGASWGMQGYIKMSRNHKNNCGIATAATLPKC